MWCKATVERYFRICRPDFFQEGGNYDYNWLLSGGRPKNDSLGLGKLLHMVFS